MKYIFVSLFFIVLFICFPTLLWIIPIAYVIGTGIIALKIVEAIEELSDLNWNTGNELIDVMMVLITSAGSMILGIIIWGILLVIGLLLIALPASILM